MTPAPYFIFVPGVRTDVEARDTWIYRAEKWCDDRGLSGDSYPYHVLATARQLEQAKHAAGVRQLLVDRAWNHPHIVLVGHSNGCELICRAISGYRSWGRLDLHLIAGACDASFAKNGLNDALQANRVDRVFCYCSGADRALELASVSRRWFGWFGLGYGDLGRVGPQNIDWPVDHRVGVRWFDGFDHSDYFAGDNFDETMKLVATSAQQEPSDAPGGA